MTHRTTAGTRAARIVTVIAALSVAAAAVAGTEAPARVAAELPIRVPDASFRSLDSSIDQDLQRKLRARLRREPLWAKLIRDQRMAVGVVDLTDVTRPRFARVNGDHMMYAASLPKIAILLAATQAVDEGILAESQDLLTDITDMIRVSSNTAATRVVERLGLDYIARSVTDPRWRLFDPRRGGGLWVGKPYAKEGERHGDPLRDISHAATATQTCRFYYLLTTGRLLSEQRSRQMLDALSEPGLHHKFIRALEQRAPGAQAFRKSGSWRSWHSDSVLVWGPDWRRYILVALVQHDKGDLVVEGLVAAVEELLQPKHSHSVAPQEARHGSDSDRSTLATLRQLADAEGNASGDAPGAQPASTIEAASAVVLPGSAELLPPVE